MKQFILTLAILLTATMSFGQYIGAGINVPDTTWDMTIVTGPNIGEKVFRAKGNKSLLLGFNSVKFPYFSGTGTRVIGFNADGSIYSFPQYSLIDTTKIATKWYSSNSKDTYNQGTGILKTGTSPTFTLSMDPTQVMGVSRATDSINALKTILAGKQSTLLSGSSIRTIETQSLMGSGNIDLSKSDVGLSNVDNTSDASKPVSLAVQTALNGKLSAEVDGSVTNEIQSLSISGQNLSISGGNTITLPTASLPNTGTAGTYGKVTTDAQGRVVSGKRQETYSGTTDASGNYTVTFPVAFPVAPNIQAQLIGGTDLTFFRVSSVTATGFTVYAFGRSSVTSLPIVGTLTGALLGSAGTALLGASIDVLVTEK